jgi:hypothetical protein
MSKNKWSRKELIAIYEDLRDQSLASANENRELLNKWNAGLFTGAATIYSLVIEDLKEKQ